MKLMHTDLNGTARYVGMGGAMEALGADISTMGTNPAGTALITKTQVSMSGGVVMQPGASNISEGNGIGIRMNGKKDNLSFDQIGVVAPITIGGEPYVTVGFNYHKSRNFDQILTAAGRLNQASQGKLSAIKYHKVGNWAWNGVDANYQDIFETVGSDGNKTMDYYDATAYVFGQYQKGYIGQYDFNISGNINNRVYMGVTIGAYDVNYQSNSYYTENLEQNAVSSNWESLKIDGTGFDVKVGAIFLPIENSPFRIGVYLSTPVFYDLTMHGTNSLTIVKETGDRRNKDQHADYDFRLYTPWKFGLSLGHTVGQMLALGATYEYADYGAADNRIIDDDLYDPYHEYIYRGSSQDDVMNNHTENTLKGVHTLKVGLEFKPVPILALRAGYNYISAAFEENAFRDGSLESPGVGYATSTDYTNWKATNRFTLGAGIKASKNFNIDLAYQYSKTNGDFFPFMSYSGDSNPSNNCVANGTSVTNHRSQLLATLTYRF